MISKDIEIVNKLGLHARAAAKLVQTASKFRSEIKIRRGKEPDTVDAKSILGILLLAAAKGTVLNVSAAGEDEEAALAAIANLVAARFDEAE